MGAELNMFFVDGLKKRFQAVVSVRAALRNVLSRLFLLVLDLLNSEEGRHKPPDKATPRLLLMATKLFQLLPRSYFSGLR